MSTVMNDNGANWKTPSVEQFLIERSDYTVLFIEG